MNTTNSNDSFGKDNPLFPMMFATAVGAIHCILDLTRIQAYFPGVIQKEDAMSFRAGLFRELKCTLDSDKQLLKLTEDVEKFPSNESGKIIEELTTFSVLIKIQHPSMEEVLAGPDRLEE